MELVKYLDELKMPVTLITNCSLLHMIDLDELKKYIQFVTCSIDSTYEVPYCKVLGCIWYSSQPVTTFAKNYMRGLGKIISQKRPELAECELMFCHIFKDNG